MNQPNETNDQLYFEKLHPAAILPSRGSVGSCGLDVYSIEQFKLLPGVRTIVRTGLAVAIPHGCYGRVAARSGLVFKHGINVLGGVIDADYRGEVLCLLVNLGEDAFVIQKGDRIAQLIVEKVSMLDPEWTANLDKTERDTGGFGSSGR